jgi:hypothetical protein
MTKDLAKWASEHGQIIQSGLSYGRREKFILAVLKLGRVGYNLKVMWEMSVNLVWLQYAYNK